MDQLTVMAKREAFRLTGCCFQDTEFGRLRCSHNNKEYVYSFDGSPGIILVPNRSYRVIVGEAISQGACYSDEQMLLVVNFHNEVFL